MSWPIEFGNENPAPSLDWPLKTSLVASIGSNTATFSRASVASIDDFEAFNLNALAEEARFVGTRREGNMAQYSEDLTNAFWTKTNLTPEAAGSINGLALTKLTLNATNGQHKVAHSYNNLRNNTALVFGCYVDVSGMTTKFSALTVGKKEGGIAARVDVTFTDANTATVSTATSSTYLRVIPLGNYSAFIFLGAAMGAGANVPAASLWAGAQGNYLGGGEYIIASKLFVCDVTNRKNKTTPEYLSNNVLSAPFFGANVDGVKNYWYKNLRRLLSYGDSLSYGTGATSVYTSNYEKRLENLVGMECIAYGVGGENSTQIKTRLLADTTLAENFTIIWAGRNNFTSPETVKSDIAAMVAACTGGYLVLSIINADYSIEYAGNADYITLIQLNSDLAALYGNKFVDVRSPLVAGYNPGDAQDVIDHGHDIPPLSLRYDDVHLNNAGYLIVAQTVAARIQQLGWDTYNEAIAEETLKGILSEQDRTNYFLNSRVPVTQTIDLTTPGTGDYTLRVTGTGNVTCAANGATGTGFGVASAGTDITFNLSAAGTVNFTCADIAAGDTVQVEKGAFASSFIETGAAAETRVKDVVKRTGTITDELPVNDFVIAGEFTPMSDVGALEVFVLGTYVDANNYTGLLRDGTNIIYRKRIAGSNIDLSHPFVPVVGTTYKYVIKQSSTIGSELWIESSRVTNSDTTDIQVGAIYQQGGDGNEANQDFSCHKNVLIYNKAITDKKLLRLTA